MMGRYPKPHEIEFSWTRIESWDGEEVETDCLVTATISGQDRPARWGQDGGTPTEYAEVDVVAVNIIATGADIVDDLTQAERAEVEVLAEIEVAEYAADAADAAAEARADAAEDR